MWRRTALYLILRHLKGYEGSIKKNIVEIFRYRMNDIV